MFGKQAFTLIELLIVVAIIAILAAIAVPNFLEAQTRSKVSRAKTDMRSCMVAMESYRVDANKYPINFGMSYGYVGGVGPGDPYRAPVGWGLWQLTTPIGYIASLPADPFSKLTYTYEFHNWGKGGNEYYSHSTELVGLRSLGPDQRRQYLLVLASDTKDPKTIYITLYDPTNGTVSRGDILSWAPGAPNQMADTQLDDPNKRPDEN
jgi:prepilin-type N-terminal cleavage/methylation domain-containing protein